MIIILNFGINTEYDGKYSEIHDFRQAFNLALLCSLHEDAPFCSHILRRAGRDLADAVLMIRSSSDQVNAASKLLLSPSVFPNHELLCCACEVF